jgi:uncharacterized protein
VRTEKDYARTSRTMFSLQALFGKGELFHELLEQSAEEARESVHFLVGMLRSPVTPPALDELVFTRRKEKKITEQISEELVSTFITGLEREDIEALSRALYKIPKSVEKFAERYSLTGGRVPRIAFARQAELLEKATGIVFLMVKQLRDVQQLERVKELNDRLQYVEGEADKFMVELLRDLYSGRHDALQVVISKDLFELLEKVIDRCRDAGSVIVQIALKNS